MKNGESKLKGRHHQIVRNLENWFENEQRKLPWRDSYDPYHVWIAEVMAQQTRMMVVLRYWTEFVARFPSVEALASAAEESVLAAWSGLGYYRRARMLRTGAAEIVERFGGVIPSDPETLGSISGIGRYTAGAIASIGFDSRVPIVDGNILRVLARLETIEEPLGSRELEKKCWSLAEKVVDLSRSPRNINQGLMELGALICTPVHPRCGDCPVEQHCAAAAGGQQATYPRPRIRQQTIDMVVPVFLVRDGRGRVMIVRTSTGTLTKEMFRLPGGNAEITASTGVEHLTPLTRLGDFRHSITNRRVRFEVWDATAGESIADSVEDDVCWVSPGDLGSVPHPSWVRKAIEMGELHEE